MRGIKLKRSLLCFATVFCIVFSLCGCKEEEISIDDMPEIVFVVYQFHNENDDEGNFLGEICKGYYIKRTGEIKYFEFDGDEVEQYGEIDDEITNKMLKNKKFTVDDVVKVLNIKVLHEKFSQYDMDSGYDNIPEEDMINCYRLLMDISKRKKVEHYSINTTLYVGYTGCYGVRMNKRGEQEFIPIYERGGAFNFRDSNRQELCEDLKNLLPNNKLRYF